MQSLIKLTRKWKLHLKIVIVVTATDENIKGSPFNLDVMPDQEIKKVEVEDMKSKIHEKKQMRNEIIQNNKKLEEEVLALRKKLEQQADLAKIQVLEEHTKMMEGETNQLKKQLENTLTRQHSLHEEHIKPATAELERQAQAKSTLAELRKALQLEMEEVKLKVEELENSKTEISDHSRIANDLEESRVHIEQRLEELNTQNDDQKKKNHRLTIVLESELKEVKEKLTQEEEFAKNLALARARLDLEVHNLRKKITETQKIKAKLEEETKGKNELESSKSKLETELLALKQQFVEENKARAKLEVELDELKNQMTLKTGIRLPSSPRTPDNLSPRGQQLSPRTQQMSPRQRSGGPSNNAASRPPKHNSRSQSVTVDANRTIATISSNDNEVYQLPSSAEKTSQWVRTQSVAGAPVVSAVTKLKREAEENKSMFRRNNSMSTISSSGSGVSAPPEELSFKDKLLLFKASQENAE